MSVRSMPLLLLAVIVAWTAIVGAQTPPASTSALDEALRAVTIYAAHQIGLGDSIGSLEKGKEADLVILDSDPYKTKPEKLGDIKISETWVAGEKKYGG